MRAALAAVGVMALSACGDGGAPVQFFDGDPPIFTFHGDGEMEAIVDGRLVYLDEEQCIVLEQGGGHDQAVFRSGSDAYLEPDGTLIVEVAGYGPLREGVWITAGGGTLSSDSGLGLPMVPAGCASDGRSFAVIQQISDVQLEAPSPE